MAPEPVTALAELPTTYRLHNGAKCSPELRQRIVAGLKEGVGILKLASILGCSHHTVEAIRDQTPNLGTDWKGAVSGKLKAFIHLVADDLLENPNQISPDSKPIALAVAIDKVLLLDGEATQIVEHRHSVDVASLKNSLSLLPEITVEPIAQDHDKQQLTQGEPHLLTPQ